MSIKRVLRVQRCIQITDSQNAWLNEHEEINVSALVRRFLDDYIKEHELR